MTQRSPLNRRDLLTLFIQQDGKCLICGNKLYPDATHDDHIVALKLGGGNELTNRRLICAACHKIKTSGKRHTSLGSDIHAMAKTKRLAAGPRKRRGRPWPKRKVRG